MAVLYRSNLQSEPIESALRERQIPLRMVGGTQFYERKEVKDVLAYLRVVLSSSDEIALRRIVNYPARQIGEAALDKLVNFANTHRTTLFDAVERAGTIADMPSGALAGCGTLGSVVRAARAALETGVASAHVARTLADAVGLRTDILSGSSSPKQAEYRWGNVESLLRVLERHDARAAAAASKGTGTRDKLAELIRFLTLNPDDDDEPSHNAVTLTTMHGAKGLEYEVVFIAGLEEGLMPHARSLDGRATDVGGKLANDVEEERRLFYVSITRAKDRLYLVRSRQRTLRGKTMLRTPSRFLQNIADELVEKHEVQAPAAPSFSDTAAHASALLAALGSRRT
jgi:DNA helicase-2/ATP-dependent DNA helicase PcrA